MSTQQISASKKPIAAGRMLKMIKAIIIMKKRVTIAKKKRKTAQRQMPCGQNCNEVIYNGIL